MTSGILTGTNNENLDATFRFIQHSSNNIQTGLLLHLQIQVKQALQLNESLWNGGKGAKNKDWNGALERAWEREKDSLREIKMPQT